MFGTFKTHVHVILFFMKNLGVEGGLEMKGKK